jgi:hypothetical protein
MRNILMAGVVVSMAGVASADTVKLQYEGMGYARSVRVTIGSSTFNTSAGQMMHKFTNGNGVATQLNGQTKVTFCTDLTEGATSNGAIYTVAPIANLPQTSGWPAMGSTRAQGVYNLYATAAGLQNGTSNDWAAAFQIALWEVVYDYSGTSASLSLTAGNFKAKDTDGTSLTSSIATKVATLFAGVVGSSVTQTGLMGLTNNGCQDQIVQVDTIVPLPGAASMGLAALGAGFMVRRLRRRA